MVRSFTDATKQLCDVFLMLWWSRAAKVRSNIQLFRSLCSGSIFPCINLEVYISFFPRFL